MSPEPRALGKYRVVPVAKVSLATYLRYRKPAVLAVSIGCASVILLGSWADHRGHLTGLRERASHYDGAWFQVNRVVGANALDLTPRGTTCSRPVKTRLWGLGQRARGPNAAEARRFARSLCLGQPVRIWVYPQQLRDRSGRLLAYVQLIDGTYLNERLLAAGAAEVDSRLIHPMGPRYVLLDQQARRDAAGIWGPAPLVIETTDAEMIRGAQ